MRKINTSKVTTRVVVLLILKIARISDRKGMQEDVDPSENVWYTSPNLSRCRTSLVSMPSEEKRDPGRI